MFSNPQAVQAEIAYRQERITRDFRRSAGRRQRRETARQATARPARRLARHAHAA